jgi:hypothetical protein
MDIGLRLCPFVAGLTLVASSAFAQAPNPTRTPVGPVTRAADEPQRRWNRLGRPTAAAASRGNVVLFCGLGNHVDLRGVLGGAEGIRTDDHRERSEISSYSSLRQSIRAACSRLAPSIAIDALASVAVLWLRSPASRRSPRDKVDRSRRGGDAANTGRIFS